MLYPQRLLHFFTPKVEEYTLFLVLEYNYI